MSNQRRFARFLPGTAINSLGVSRSGGCVRLGPYLPRQLLRFLCICLTKLIKSLFIVFVVYGAWCQEQSYLPLAIVGKFRDPLSFKFPSAACSFFSWLVRWSLQTKTKPLWLCSTCRNGSLKRRENVHARIGWVNPPQPSCLASARLLLGDEGRQVSESITSVIVCTHFIDYNCRILL